MGGANDNPSFGPQSEAGEILTSKAPKFSSDLTDLFLVIFTVLFAVALLAHGYVGFFSRYMADDYCAAAAVHSDGLLSSQKSLYLGWSGRFSSNFAIGGLALLGHQIVPFLPALALVFMLVVLTWTISRFGSEFGWRRPLLTSCLLAELIIFVTVSDNRGGVYEALYWQTGVLTYWFPLILMVAYVGFVKYVDASTSRIRPRALYWFLGAALTFTAGGFNETYAVFQMCGLLVATGFRFWAKRFKLLPLVAGLIGSIVATAIVSLAPGNDVRRANFPPPPDWLTLLNSSAESTFKFMFSEQNYPGTYLYRAAAMLIPALLAVYTIPRAGRLAARNFVSGRKTQWLTVLVLPLICFVVIMSCFVPAIYFMSKQPPPRALVIPEFVLIFLLVAWSYYTGHLLRQKYLEDSRRRFPLLAGIAVLLAAALALAPIRAACNTFSKVSRVKALATLWDKQDQEIRAAKERGETDLTVPVAYNIGGTDLMTADPQWYVNQCVASYYRVNTITARPSLEGLKIISNVPEE